MPKIWTHNEFMHNYKAAEVGDLFVEGNITWILRTKREYGEWSWDVLDPFDVWVNEVRANAAE